IVVVAFVFFNWLVPQKSQPEAIKSARSRVVLQSTGDWLESLLPENLDTYITNILKKKPKADDQDQPPPDQRGQLSTQAQHWSGLVEPPTPSGIGATMEPPTDGSVDSDLTAGLDLDLHADRLREECGVFGIYGHPDAAAITALGLHALQHRGQEAAGIVSY